ncbi:ATPase, F1/V1/A1 complex, alpha/beta subunit [Tanacetum coccineum]
MDRFGKDLAISTCEVNNEHYDLANWWGTFGGATPNLKTITMRILSLTSSSSGCERNWSTFEGIHTKKRNRLEASKLNNLVYVTFKFNLTEKAKRRKERNVEVLLSNDSHMTQECIVECDGDENRDGDEEVEVQPDLKPHWEANPDVNLLKEDVGNVSVWVKLHGDTMTEFSEDGLSTIATKLELKDIIMVAMPKLIGEGFHICTIHVEYEWKPPRGVHVGPKVDFKANKQVYRPVSNRNNGSSSGKKKQVAIDSKEVSNSNPFDVLNSVKKDDELGTNEGHSKSDGKGPNPDMYPSDQGFLNVACSSTTPIVERIDEIERQIIDGQITLVDDDGKPLTKVVSMTIVDSDSEVEDAVDHHAVFMASTSLKCGADSGYDTNSLLEKWRKTKLDDDYDPYDDDLYESHDMSENL